MDLGIRGRVAIVTGGARGIGYAHCEALAAEGVNIALIDLDEAAMRDAAASLSAYGTEVIGIAADACDEQAVNGAKDDVLAYFRRVDILINNAGLGVKPAYAVADMPLEAWDLMIRSHTRSTFLWSRSVLKTMADREFGRIINTSSMNFTGGGRPGVAHYAAAKAAIVGFTQTLAKEVGSQGITVNALAPGYVATALIDGFNDDMLQRLQQQNPKGRLCRPEEVASLAAYLCSPRADFINGELLCLDGGRRDFVWN